MTIKSIHVLFFLFNTINLCAQHFYKEKLDNFIYEEKQEKVYLHFDKPQYAAGDDIWFKAYITSAVSHLPTEVSWNLYVELINDEKRLLDSLTLFIENGVAHGSFSLNRDLKPGSYRIRAYTEWMRNSDNDFFYRKDFKIVNPSFNEELNNIQKETIPKRKLMVDFLAEGGDLIDGISTKIAIRATDINGRGIPVNGAIINDKGEKVTAFEANDLGYGLCFFKPKIEESYLALIQEDTFYLPKVKNAGATIRVTHSYGSENVHIAVLSKNIDLKDGTLVIHRRGQLLISAKSLNDTTMVMPIKKSSLGAGIIHITFFDKNRIPLSERLVFPNPPVNETDISIIPDRNVYEKRSKVTLGLGSKSDTIHSASLTINPQIESSYQEDGENIKNYLLLSSDLKGRIDSPESYLTGTEEAYRALDVLMLTHGWFRFDWESLLASDFSPQYLPEKGLKIWGKAINYYNDKDLNEPLIGLTIPSIGVLNETFKISEHGTFQIAGLVLMDSTVIFMQAFREKNDKIKEYQSAKIELEYPPRPDVNQVPHNESDVKPDFLAKTKKLEEISIAYFLDNQVTELEEVVVTTKNFKQDEMDRRTTLYSEPDNRLIMDSLGVFYTSVFDALYRVPGVTVTGTFPNQSARIRGPVSLYGSNEPAYFLDGMLVDVAAIQMLPVQDVEFIDVIKGAQAATIGSRGAAGAILVYTRRGGSSNQRERPSGLLSFTHPGYHKAKEFYSPQYDLDREEHIIPDFRTTLHWNPKLAFENNYTETTFYTSDQTGSFVIRVEGMFTNGEPFFEEHFIYVE